MRFRKRQVCSVHQKPFQRQELPISRYPNKGLFKADNAKNTMYKPLIDAKRKWAGCFLRDTSTLNGRGWRKSELGLQLTS